MILARSARSRRHTTRHQPLWPPVHWCRGLRGARQGFARIPGEQLLPPPAGRLPVPPAVQPSQGMPAAQVTSLPKKLQVITFGMRPSHHLACSWLITEQRTHLQSSSLCSPVPAMLLLVWLLPGGVLLAACLRCTTWLRAAVRLLRRTCMPPAGEAAAGWAWVLRGRPRCGQGERPRAACLRHV